MLPSSKLHKVRPACNFTEYPVDTQIVVPKSAKRPLVSAERQESGKASDSTKKQRRTEVSADEKHKKDMRTLFVGNVPLSINSRTLCSKFKEFGSIESSRFRSCPVKNTYQKGNKRFGVMKKDFIEGVDEAKLSQNAYIVYKQESSVKAAVDSKLGGTDIFESGHVVRLDFCIKSSNENQESASTKKFDRKKSIYVPHVPPTATELDITSVVESIAETLKGTVRGIRIVRTEKNGAFAYVLFSERCHATTAVKSCPGEGVQRSFPGIIKPVTIKIMRVKKEDELASEKAAKLQEFEKNASEAAKKSLSRMKWQARLTRKGIAKVVSHHAMPRKERQEKMKGAALRIMRKIKK